MSDLTTIYAAATQRVVAVRDVSFSVGQGEIIGVVGESGSGKSALALSLLGLIEPPGRVFSGVVRLNGRDLRRLSDREMGAVRGREMSLIFQDPMTSLNPVKTVGEQIAEALRRHSGHTGRADRRRQVVSLLEEVEIPAAARRIHEYPHQYSGGMRQRVMIAIALANRPGLVIADEPTTALDVTTQAQIIDLLQRLATAHGTAVIFITHNLGIVSNFCDRVHVMYAGRFVETAETEAMFSQPVHPYTEKLLASVPRAASGRRKPLPFIPGSPPAAGAADGACAFEPRCHVGRGKAICRTQMPPTVSLPNGRFVECHFARERA